MNGAGTRMPRWVVQTLVGLFLSTCVAWLTWATMSNSKYETRISVAEAKMTAMDKRLDEFSEGQKDIVRKLDLVLMQGGRK